MRALGGLLERYKWHLYVLAVLVLMSMIIFIIFSGGAEWTGSRRGTRTDATGSDVTGTDSGNRWTEPEGHPNGWEIMTKNEPDTVRKETEQTTGQTATEPEGSSRPNAEEEEDPDDGDGWYEPPGQHTTQRPTQRPTTKPPAASRTDAR